MKRVGIIGASGYTGAELLRLCAQHPEFDVVYATGDSQAGTLASSSAPVYPDAPMMPTRFTTYDHTLQRMIIQLTFGV